MKLKKNHSLKEIAGIIQCEFVGNPDHVISGLNEIHVVVPGDIVFVDHPKYYDKALNSAATTILINKKVECPQGKALLISDDPCRDFNKLNAHFMPIERFTKSIGEHTTIHPSAFIYPNVTIGNNVSIGENTVIYPGVVIMDHTSIGKNVIIQSNTVIGGDAFYYKKRGEVYDKMFNCGRVIIHDSVEIGSNCTIDRGLTGDTTIGEGTKIDNLVQIGHDTIIGKNCLFASQVGIAGCVIIGNGVTLWGQVGVKSDVHIEDNVTVMAQSGVGDNLKSGHKYFGSPCEEVRGKYREMMAIKSVAEEYLNRKNKN